METKKNSDVPQVRWGIIGCGNIATHAVAPAIQWSKNADLVAVASRQIGQAQIKANDLKVEHAFGSYQDLIESDLVDALYIATPNGLHEETVIPALESGKHVLCEKSIALKTPAARLMAETAKANKTLLMEAFMYRHHPQWDVVRDIIKKGDLGDIRLIRSALCGKLLDTEDHRWSATIGGGALYDVTCYPINVARMLYCQEPLNVTAHADTGTKEKVDRMSTGILDFGNGKLALCTGSLCTVNHQFCEVEGTQGRLHIPSPFIPGFNETTLYLEHGYDTEEIQVKGANHYLHMVEHFSACILDRSLSLYPAEDGLDQTMVSVATEQSWISGKTVDISDG